MSDLREQVYTMIIEHDASWKNTYPVADNIINLILDKAIQAVQDIPVAGVCNAYHVRNNAVNTLKALK